ncbi:DNA replication/repair protein RecF [Phragmitibacter flavus]|uniref:DNA replication and repair protein RecF n=1 Tax=Phragmitibacter flavus TaxID=2576071 RepID=A0A5R8KHV9_9BACT|nr:DNA replication and repair protein RecF [Phragmitibacter flavus]TLD71898.1 DNA replication/repair protein RecF [Phragmitibacter flavus]
MLSQLLVRDFRCFAEAKLALHPATTLLVGNNAQGKTSLLEALCVVLRLQSPRTSTRTDLIRFGTRSCLVEASLGDHQLRFAQSATTRRLAVDNVVCTRSPDYLQSSARVVWMDHSDMLLVRGGAEHRRRYLDFAAAQLNPGYLHALRHYERLLRSRNHLLKRDAVINWRQADAYAVALEEHGHFISQCRAQLAESLTPHVNTAHAALSGGHEIAQIQYQPGFDPNGLAQQLRDARADEERTRTTAAGIHRDDLQLLVNDRPASAFASEGQQRSLSLALKLAQVTTLTQATGSPPLLLIDDVFGELDHTRRRALLNALPQDTQKVITTTSVDWITGDFSPDGWQYHVDKAALGPLVPVGSRL